jgi:transposase
VVGRRCIGLDVHRDFAQVAIWENGKTRHVGQVAVCGEALWVFADSLGPEDEVAIEATCNTHAIVRAIEPRVKRVVVSNPMKTRAIAEAKVKTDKVDAAVLAELLAADYLPSVWVADEQTPGAAAPSRASHTDRATAHTSEESGAGDPSSQPRAALPVRGPVRRQGTLLARRSTPPTR